MRARRHRLQVSTFPFLAVLLCAMGSLILVLLVMDRRSHLAARARAERESALRAEEVARARAAESRRLADEANAEWEKKRAALHARLEAERRDVEGREKDVRARLEEAEARARALREKVARLRGEAEGERGRVGQGELELTAARKEADEKAARAASDAGERARLEGEAVRLEKAVAGLKQDRERKAQTYSVIPYRGKHGEARRPLYVECTTTGWVFHPDARPVAGDDPAGARAEVERRAAARGESKPYLLLLVRPDGVQNYYRLQSALRELGAEYGYEFVDAGWRFDFPEEEQVSRAPPVPGRSAAGPSPPKRPAGVALARPGGASGGPAGEGGTGPTGGGASAPGQGEGGGAGAGRGGLGAPGGGGRAGTPAVALMPASPSGGGDGPSGAGGTDGDVPRGVPGIAGVLRPVPADDGAPAGGPGQSGAGPGGPPEVAPPALGPPGMPGGGVGGPGGASASEARQAKPADGPADPVPGAKDREVGNLPHKEEEGPGPAGRSRPDPAARLAPPLPGGGGRRPLAPAWLHGNRDWVVYVECRTDGVVLYPSRRAFALESLSHSPAHNAFYQAVRQMIARKQASVPRGEAPYRPEVRFLVRPEGLQTMYAAHYALEALGVPRTQQSLARDDDVEAFLLP